MKNSRRLLFVLIVVMLLVGCTAEQTDNTQPEDTSDVVPMAEQEMQNDVVSDELATDYETEIENETEQADDELREELIIEDPSKPFEIVIKEFKEDTFVTFEYAAGGYSFEYPEDWFISTNKRTMSKTIPKGVSLKNYKIISTPGPLEGVLEDTITIDFGPNHRNIQNGEELDICYTFEYEEELLDCSPIDLNGISATRVYVESNVYGMHRRIVYIFDLNGIEYSTTGHVRVTDTIDEDIENIEKILRTFTVN